MLPRITNAAPRESEMDQATVPDALNTNHGLAAGTQAHTGGSDAAQGSPDRYSLSTAGLIQATGQLLGLQLDQASGQVYDLQLDAAPAAVDLARLAAGDNMSTDGLEQDLSRAFPESTATVTQPKNTPNAGQNGSVTVDTIWSYVRRCKCDFSVVAESERRFTGTDCKPGKVTSCCSDLGAYGARRS